MNRWKPMSFSQSWHLKSSLKGRRLASELCSTWNQPSLSKLSYFKNTSDRSKKNKQPSWSNVRIRSKRRRRLMPSFKGSFRTCMIYRLRRNSIWCWYQNLKRKRACARRSSSRSWRELLIRKRCRSTFRSLMETRSWLSGRNWMNNRRRRCKMPSKKIGPKVHLSKTHTKHMLMTISLSAILTTPLSQMENRRAGCSWDLKKKYPSTFKRPESC